MESRSSRIQLTGDLDAASVPAFRRIIHDTIDRNPGGSITIDLSPLEFIDSTGLGLLIGTLKKAQSAGGDVVFTMPPRSLWRVFTVTGLSEAFTFEDVDASGAMRVGT